MQYIKQLRTVAQDFILNWIMFLNFSAYVLYWYEVDLREIVIGQTYSHLVIRLWHQAPFTQETIIIRLHTPTEASVLDVRKTNLYLCYVLEIPLNILSNPAAVITKVMRKDTSGYSTAGSNHNSAKILCCFSSATPSNRPRPIDNPGPAQKPHHRDS